MIRFRKGALPIVGKDPSTQVDPKMEAINAQDNEEELVFSSVPGSQQWKARPIMHEWWETPGFTRAAGTFTPGSNRYVTPQPLYLTPYLGRPRGRSESQDFAHASPALRENGTTARSARW